MGFGQPAGGIETRRKPRQSRSVMTVNAILDATRILMVEHGFDATTTTLIAERAGVSVGSLYEYFANKEVLISELFKRHCDKLLYCYQESLRALHGRPPLDVFRVFIDVTYETYAQNFRFHRTLLEYGNTPKAHPYKQYFTLKTMELLISALKEGLPDLQEEEVRRAAFMVGSLVEALTTRSIQFAPELFESRLKDDIHEWVEKYVGFASHTNAMRQEA